MNGPADVGGVGGRRVEVRVLRQEEGRTYALGVSASGESVSAVVRRASMSAHDRPVSRASAGRPAGRGGLSAGPRGSAGVPGRSWTRRSRAVLLVEGTDADQAHAVEQPADEGHQGLAAQLSRGTPRRSPCSGRGGFSPRHGASSGMANPLRPFQSVTRALSSCARASFLGAADLEAPPAVPRRVGEPLQLVGVDPLLLVEQQLPEVDQHEVERGDAAAGRRRGRCGPRPRGRRRGRGSRGRSR